MTDQIEWPSELPKVGAQRAADLKAGEFYDGREVANVSPIGGGVVVIRFAGGGTLKVMGDQALTDFARLEDAVAAFDLAYRRMRYLYRVGAVLEWPPAMEEGKTAVEMLNRGVDTGAEARAAIMVAEILTSGMVDLTSFYAPGVDLPGKDLLDEYDRDAEADEADHAETFPAVIIDWRGVSRAGLARTGRMDVPDLELFVRSRFDNGWRSLLVVGPAGQPVGGINQLHGRRGWWSE